jgi:hypothetical protein
MNTFTQYAPIYHRNGYSTLPIKPGTKRPVQDKWDSLRLTPMKDWEIKRYAAGAYGIGAVGGFNDLVPMDIDTNDPFIINAIRRVLPPLQVVKTGQKGFTAFFRGKVHACKLKGKDGRPIVEVLTTTQTVLPPTVHPGQKADPARNVPYVAPRPYRWMTGSTLENTHIRDLPIIDQGHIDALRAVLAPWMPAPVVVAPTPTLSQKAAVASNLGAQERRHLGYAKKVLATEARIVATTVNGDRNNRLFNAACKLGKYMHHGILQQDATIKLLIDACKSCGLDKDEGGLAGCYKTIKKGLEYSANDALPVLKDRLRKTTDQRPYA